MTNAASFADVADLVGAHPQRVDEAWRAARDLSIAPTVSLDPCLEP